MFFILYVLNLWDSFKLARVFEVSFCILLSCLIIILHVCMRRIEKLIKLPYKSSIY